MSAPVLELQNIAVSAGGQCTLNVPRFTVAAGETVALLGPNGAGKTTLLHVAALLRQPDLGTVMIHGERASAAAAARLRRAMSVVFQDPLLFDVDVLANAAAGARFQGWRRADAERQASLWLGRFGVAHLAQRRARRLSGGEAARVALARAFATEPAILLLDEPFSALDAPTRATLLPTLRQELRETGTAAVLVTHDLEEAFAFAARIDLMDAGEIVASGPAPSLIASPPSRRAAELLGIETILDARVVRSEAGNVLLEIAPDGPVVRACLPIDESLLPDEAVTLTLPASGTSITQPDGGIPAGWNRLLGIVAAVTPLPTGKRLIVKTPVPMVTIAPWQPLQHDWVVGDEAVVSFAPEAVHIIRGSS